METDLKDLIENETGKRFNKNKMCCPFHSEKTPSFTIKKYSDKDRYYCFGCGAKGDEIDFVMKYKNMTYIEACNYLGIELDPATKEIYSNIEKVEKVAKNIKDLTFIKLYSFTGSDSKVLYFKAKFKDNEGNKQCRYYHLNNGNVEFSRGHIEVPYNYSRLVRAIENKKPIFILEGEKDADTLAFYGYTTTSFKGVKKFDYSIFKDAVIYIIPDNDKPGEDYKNNLWSNMKDYVKEFNVVYPKSFRKAPKGYDITDWFNDNNTIDDFKRELKDNKWDYKKSTLWKDVKKTQNGNYAPLETSENLEILLNRKQVGLKYNSISKRIDVFADKTVKFLDKDAMQDITDICTKNFFNFGSKTKENGLYKIAINNKYNPFIDKIKKHRNNNYSLIDDFFNCLVIDEDYKEYEPLFKSQFIKFLRGMVIQSQSTLKNTHACRGIIVLVGPQGIGKSRFLKALIRNNDWCKAEGKIDFKSKNASKRDAIKQATHYVLYELAEINATIDKGTIEEVKSFITGEIDEYRASHEKLDSILPRTTTFVGTTNNTNYLVDDTGNRRFYTMPIVDIDIEKAETLNNFDMLGAIYDQYLKNLQKKDKYFETLNPDESKLLAEVNKNFMYEKESENILEEKVKEKFDFTQKKAYWRIYGIREIYNILEIDYTRTRDNYVKDFFSKKYNIKYQSQLDKYTSKKKYGFKLPNINANEVEDFKIADAKNPFNKPSTKVIEMGQRQITWAK